MLKIPEHMPSVKGAHGKWLGDFILKKMGWSITGELPNEPKIVVAGAPHTSNWDFVIGLAVLLSTGMKVTSLMKKEAFVWPLSLLWNWFGFIPTDRKAANGIVNDVVKHFKNKDKLWVAIAPEGTRSKNTYWKKGFLRIAHEANVPICLLILDYTKKEFRFDKVLRTSGDHDKDLQEVREHFAPYSGKRPNRQG